MILSIFNNFWKIRIFSRTLTSARRSWVKWDCLRTEADPLEAQEAESGVKKRGAEASSQPERQRQVGQRWMEEKKSRRSYQRAPA